MDFSENARLRLTRDTVYGKTHVQIYEVAEQYYIVSGAYEKHEKKSNYLGLNRTRRLL